MNRILEEMLLKLRGLKKKRLKLFLAKKVRNRSGAACGKKVGGC